MTNEAELKDIFTRTIILIYGVLTDDRPYWIYAAVKPSKYADFQAAHKAGTLDVHAFEPYGEIIVAGIGTSPPEEVTLKLAQLYQTEPANLAMPEGENPPATT